MPKIKELIQPPPEPEGSEEQQISALRDYLVKITQELYYLLTHLEADNINDSTFQKISEMIPRPYVGQPLPDGDPSSGQSSQWARGDHRHGHDSTKADVTALEAAMEALEDALELEADAREDHENDTDNPHEVTAAQTGAMPNTATMDDIQNGTTYAKTTAAQVAQIGTNQTNIGTIEGKIPSAASQSNQLADKAFVTDSITQGTAIFRGSFASKAALLAVQWQTTDPNAANYVSNNDYAVVLDDETQSGECWRYIYVTGTGWTPQYRINESPLTQAQLDALNSGATAAIIGSVADKLDKTGDGKDVTATFTAASTRANISTGEKLSVLFGKIAKWFSDLGTAAFRAVTGSITSGSTDLVESGAVYTGLAGKQPTITASGILKGNGAGGVSAATAETDYATPAQLATKAPFSAGIFPGTSSTAGGTQAKIGTVPDLSGLTALYDGLTICMTFANAQTYDGQPTLDIGIPYAGVTTFGINRTAASAAGIYDWGTGSAVDLVFDATNAVWVMKKGQHGSAVRYGVLLLSDSVSESSTVGGGKAATPAAVKTAYDLAFEANTRPVLPYWLDYGTISSLPQTIPEEVLAGDTVDYFELGNPSAMGSPWTVTTADGSLTISGTCLGATSLRLHMTHNQ